MLFVHATLSVASMQLTVYKLPSNKTVQNSIAVSNERKLFVTSFRSLQVKFAKQQ